MTNKIFSTYKAGKERGIKNNDRLIVEISSDHVACLVVGGTTGGIEDFELFELPSDNFKTFEESFAYVVIGSRLLDKHYTDKKVFINTEQSVLVPADFYSKEKASDYLNVVFGENNYELFKDELQDTLPVINAYRIPVQVREVIEKNLAMVTLEHTFSNVIRTIFLKEVSASNSIINVQFYKTHFIVAVINGGELQLVNSYKYNNDEDALYHLLNICNQLNLKGASLKVCGIIDLSSSLYGQVQKYFANLSVEEILVPDMDLQEYAASYFTPFFKLAE
jgi:hypothetical protein